MRIFTNDTKKIESILSQVNANENTNLELGSTYVLKNRDKMKIVGLVVARSGRLAPTKQIAVENMDGDQYRVGFHFFDNAMKMAKV